METSEQNLTPGYWPDSTWEVISTESLAPECLYWVSSQLPKLKTTRTHFSKLMAVTKKCFPGWMGGYTALCPDNGILAIKRNELSNHKNMWRELKMYLTNKEG